MVDAFDILENMAREEGIKQGRQEIICKMLNKGESPEQINELIEEPLEYIYQIREQMHYKEKYEQGLARGVHFMQNAEQYGVYYGRGLYE